jgi:hypothetical protein
MYTHLFIIFLKENGYLLVGFACLKILLSAKLFVELL